ncbi:glycosyltransferase [Candidatus Pacearchaeota archaeon]|nr:glycosyltransferase [Candidatus Pacearchaeota archaeon]
MNCLNCEQYLREAIDSVYAQTYKDWEIVFWDNSSTDKSAEIARSYDEKLRYFRGNETVPLGKARNMAVEQARGKYIAFLDCDDFWLPIKLEKQVPILENLQEIDFVYSNYFRIIDNRQILVLRGKQPDGYVFKRFLYYYPVNMQTVMLRKSALHKLEMIFDVKLNLSEEYDLFMRILYESKATYLDEPLAVYRIHPNMSSIKFMEHYPEEIVYIIEKFKRMCPQFEEKYSTELNYLNAKLGYWRAKTEMEKGNSWKARKHLDPYKLVDYQFFLLYLMTYFPPRLWQVLHDLRDKGIFIR